MKTLSYGGGTYRKTPGYGNKLYRKANASRDGSSCQILHLSEVQKAEQPPLLNEP